MTLQSRSHMLLPAGRGRAEIMDGDRAAEGASYYYFMCRSPICGAQLSNRLERELEIETF